MKYGVLDLFAGIGGFSLGFDQVEGDAFETVAFCEIDQYAREVLSNHWPGTPIYHDAKELNRGTLESDGVRLPDIITAGWPCQDISTAGSGVGLDGERSGLWGEVARIIGELHPRFVVLENSPNLRNRGLEYVLSDLWSLGFDAEWHVVSASSVGAFHQRARLWIVAYSQRLGLPGSWELAPPVHPTPSEFGEANRFVNDFLEGSLPFVCGGHDGVPERVDHQAVKQLGNAVVPQITRQIAAAILDTLREIDG